MPASVVYEDESTIAFLDIQPINPGHVLVVPKTHAESLVELSPEDAAQVMRVGQLMDKALRSSGLHCEGVNLFIADGKPLGRKWAMSICMFFRGLRKMVSKSRLNPPSGPLRVESS